MTNKYVLDRAPEIERLEAQAALIGLDRVRDHLTGVDSGTLLDAGCGSGWVSRLIAREKPEATITGIDITTDFVDYALERAKEEKLANLDYLTGDITNLPFEDESFDFVWSQLVLFFLPNPELALSEFARVLRPGGQVKIAVTDAPFISIWPERPELSSGIHALREAVLHGWRTARVPQMLRDAGLQDVSIKTSVDRVYSFESGASPAQRLNIEESYIHAIQAQPALVGGQENADRLVGELVEFIDDPESVSLNTHWVFGAVKPATDIAS